MENALIRNFIVILLIIINSKIFSQSSSNLTFVADHSYFCTNIYSSNSDGQFDFVGYHDSTSLIITTLDNKVLYRYIENYIYDGGIFSSDLIQIDENSYTSVEIFPDSSDDFVSRQVTFTQDTVTGKFKVYIFEILKSELGLISTSKQGECQLDNSFAGFLWYEREVISKG